VCDKLFADDVGAEAASCDEEVRVSEGERGGAVMGKPEKISVLLPAYNEEWRAPATIVEILEYVQRDGRIGEIVVVDDGSSDRTVERLMRFIGRKQIVQFVWCVWRRIRGSGLRFVRD
jgi:glycosyltransferase involved in cell wall biosynthesis